MQARWAKEQKETILLLPQSTTQSEIAMHLGISDAAVSKRLAAAGWKHYQDGRASLELHLRQVENRVL